MKTIDLSPKTASSRANAVQRAISATEGRPGAKPAQTAQRKLQQWVDKSPRQASLNQRQQSPTGVKQLKGIGNEQFALVAQRTVVTAAEAFFKAGLINLKSRDLTTKFCKEHEITKDNLSDVQKELTALRQTAQADKKAVEVTDMSDKKNWLVGQIGMIEGDATIIAEKQGWDCVANTFICSDLAHSPKGKLYLSQEGVYYGADNTGHVGWGFKVWTKKDKTTLNYNGNIIWTGQEWQHKLRGTKK
jgi:hypothetical protein